MDNCFASLPDLFSGFQRYQGYLQRLLKLYILNMYTAWELSRRNT